MGESNNDGWCLYALKCRNNYLYIGVTNNLERRVKEHADGKGSKFVRSWRPFELVKVISCESGKEARQLEYQIKKLKRDKKLAVLGIEIGEVPRKYPQLQKDIENMTLCNVILNRF